MSFLEKVLSSAKDATSTHNSEIKQRLKEEIGSIEIEVKKYINNKYLKKKLNKINPDIFLKKLEVCESEISSLINTAAYDTKYNINECTSELKTFQNELKELLITIQTLSALITVDMSFKEVNANIIVKEYIGGAQALKKIKDLMNNENLYLKSLDVSSNLDFSYKNVFLTFIEEITRAWNENIKMSEQKTSGPKIVRFTIKKNACEKIHQLLNVFIMLNYKTHIWELSNFFLKSILIPIIKYNTVLNLQEDELNNFILQVKIDTDSEKTPIFTEVFVKIQQCFSFIECLNICFEDKCFLSEMATLIKNDFTECLVKDCLMQTVQISSSEIDTNLQIEIKSFQESLCSYGFYNESDVAILDFAKDIDVHFANKECLILLEKARKLMEKGLENAVYVNPDQHYDGQAALDPPPMTNPIYKISSNVLELQDLIFGILQECSKSSTMLRQRLLNTSCNILRLYQSIVVIHCKEGLQSIPRHSALFHNNCMYLAHWLLTLSKKLQSFKITPEESQLMLYLDQITSLRLLGAKYLNLQMQSQKNIILNTLRDSDLNSLNQSTKLSKTDLAITACLNQINNLEVEWYKVLPDNVFIKCIALLYNVLLGELIQKVCSAEDISSNVAQDLVNYFEKVQLNALESFKKHEALMPKIQLWQKFKELNNVLKGNLDSIDSLWANGKGLLATVFERQEIKHLIRALFKNTDRRADLLMKIK